ncbi:MAG: hypothetical protein JEZ00_02420 [Anaerolineaceae bacterium]|nr:hypothetical protein [Anaerolineaceae bacterium]
MKNKYLFYTVLMFIFTLTITACTTPQQAPAPTMDMSIIRTEVAIAMREVGTQEALANPTVESIQPPTNTPWVITATAEPTSADAVAIPSFTPMSTKKPASSYTYVAPTATWGPARLTKQTPYDNTTFSPGESFDAVFTILNNSTKNWTMGYYIRFVGGDLEPQQTQIMISDLVDRGRTIDFTVDYVAPGQGGKHTSYWEMVDNNGAAILSFWLIINVE